MKLSVSHKKNLCETSSYSILCGETIREFVSPLSPPKGFHLGNKKAWWFFWLREINNKKVKIRNKKVAVRFVELHINLNNLCVNSAYSILCGDTIREFVSPLSPPKGEVFISEIKKLGGSLCL